MKALENIKEFYLRLWCYPLSERLRALFVRYIGRANG